jgi:hypothetical protein
MVLRFISISAVDTFRQSLVSTLFGIDRFFVYACWLCLCVDHCDWTAIHITFSSTFIHICSLRTPSDTCLYIQPASHLLGIVLPFPFLSTLAYVLIFMVSYMLMLSEVVCGFEYSIVSTKLVRLYDWCVWSDTSIRTFFICSKSARCKHASQRSHQS